MNERVLVVIPALNEAATISSIVESVKAHGFDVLVVDDGSTDSTTYNALTAGATVLCLPFNLGVGGALRAGFKFAVRNNYNIVVQVDADGQHPVVEIERLLTKSRESDFDLVLGSRFITGQATMEISKLRRFAMRLLAKSASAATGVVITDATSGFRLIREPLLSSFSEQFATNYLGDTFEALVSAGRAGYSVCEIGVDIQERLVGNSTASSMQAAKFTLKAVLVAVFHLQPRIPSRNP